MGHDDQNHLFDPMIYRLVPTVITSIVCVLFLAACMPLPPLSSEAPVSPTLNPTFSTAPSSAGFAVFPAGAIPDYQLGDPYDPPVGVSVVIRDSTQPAAPGVYSICYINGFQTQPGAIWPNDLLIHEGSGLLVDPNWPDEHIIDISSPNRRDAAASRQFKVIDACVAKGYSGVEIDNLDSYTRSSGQLSLDDAANFATLLVNYAHKVGLATGQKNTSELGTRGRDEIGFDFAVAEECDQFKECSQYTDVFGARVINIEYTDALSRAFEELCSDSETPRSTILRDRMLTSPSSPKYVFQHC